MLENYVSFRKFVATNEPYLAAAALDRIPGLYPEVDARAKHAEIGRLVSQLSKLQDFDQAYKSINAYCSSFQKLKDPRFKVHKAQLLSTIVTHNDDPEIAAEAVAYYEEAARTSTHDWTPQVWMRRAQRLRQLFPKPQQTICI